VTTTGQASTPFPRPFNNPRKTAVMAALGGQHAVSLAACVNIFPLRHTFESPSSRPERRRVRPCSVYYCAQYWPRSNKVEFAVADFGIGIRRALAHNPNFRFDSDKQAIEYSLLPSVSGSTHLPRRSENWFNSRYGLHMTNRLTRNGGNFVLASRASAVLLSSKTKSDFRTSYPGTILRFNIDLSKIGDVQARLAQFLEEGFRITKTIAGSGNRPPSAMSLLCRRDYS
jgi:hypothetical protein